MKYEKRIGMPVKRGCQEVWYVLDYVHSGTVKGKNFNSIKALRKKAEARALRAKYPPRCLLAASRAQKVWMASPKYDCRRIAVA